MNAVDFIQRTGYSEGMTQPGFPANLKRFREEAKLSKKELALAVGLHPSTITLYEQGEIANPGGPTLDKLAAVLSERWGRPVLAADLLRESDEAPVTSILAQVFERLERLEHLVGDRPMLSATIIRERPVPHYGTGAANPIQGRELEDNWDLSRFSLTVAGDCLLPRIKPGTTVVFDRHRTATVGSIVAALVNGELMIKEVRERNGRWVLADAMGNQVVERDNIYVWGVMVPDPE